MTSTDEGPAQPTEWFSETDSALPNVKFSLHKKMVLHRQKSKYQDVLVFECDEKVGTVLVLDDRIQTTYFDECSYHEMITFVPLTCHPNPEKVLVIGGGDGGTIREVAKYPTVKEIILCEIDEDVINVSKKYLPKLSVGFESEKVKVVIENGSTFLEKYDQEFDVIITDSSDPIGPASSLFTCKYYQAIRKALKPPYGICCSQGECLWIHSEIICSTLKNCMESFPSVGYFSTSVPTYPGGCIGFFISSLLPEKDFTKPIRIFSADEINEMKLRFYNHELHAASFKLPNFLYDVLGSVIPRQFKFLKSREESESSEPL